MPFVNEELEGFVIRQAALARFNILVTAACNEWGGSIVSGVRSDLRNEEVGGHAQSLHRWGLAVDITWNDKEACELGFAWLIQRNFGGYIRESGVSCHIQYWAKGVGPRPEPA